MIGLMQHKQGVAFHPVLTALSMLRAIRTAHLRGLGGGWSLCGRHLDADGCRNEGCSCTHIPPVTLTVTALAAARLGLGLMPTHTQRAVSLALCHRHYLSLT